MLKPLSDYQPLDIITPIPTGRTFPQSLAEAKYHYASDVQMFKELVEKSSSSNELLRAIRTPKKFSADQRMSFLKLFRRCVCLVCDTEMTKKVVKIPTDQIIKSYGHLFKPHHKLIGEFNNISSENFTALCVLLAEYDSRGESGYELTEIFFDWFDMSFKTLSINGPRRAGKDIELSSVFSDFEGSYPCDFVISDENNKVLAIGFARYDSTRGGAQSDDRTGGNANKVDKAQAFMTETNNKFKLIFLSDGPGMVHSDTWAEACTLDGRLNGNVVVTTIKTAPERITENWLIS